MKRISVILVAMLVAFLMGGSWSWAEQGPKEHVPVNVCHATSSDTNPYVFITVDDDSTKLKGHLMHRTDPNKTWKSDGEWNGVAHLAGDPKADLIGDYVDSEGTPFVYDGVINSLEDCGSDTSPPDIIKTQAYVDFFDPTCKDEGAYILSEFNPELVKANLEGRIAPGETVTVTFTAKQDNVKIVPDKVWTHTYGEVPTDCDKPDKPEEPDEPNKPEPKADKPEPKQPELAATGANMAGLGIGAALIAAGAMLMFAKRRLTAI